ncbi:MULTISPECIES: hypothetical protein [Psychrilyobacter]|uniref:Uncharacterized protein n=1 Tax=Psychrilyobacter piezotolerans TaxID=2293438 RepID=A0ABX9KG37_9FUSO|nr:MULTISPECIES: hypothetical protein [Psychrilyobacter]MCS5420484.1 hypothetical protein [Psychrilyobacter sp. S5]NDI78261.1 hypothetical protein [Psychrilyobacter piezotolerans]RDE61181.1 hypothetical protein DV867_09280 [Psychrilyobacter sp. S5]REI40849.1 hypothetical protein DYH56_09280 [Psychrilyobacter piezotolerans]
MFNLNIKNLKMNGLFIILMIFSVPAYANDIEDSMKEAYKYYKAGEYKYSVESLNYASQLIQQEVAEGLEPFLPKPLSGWTTASQTTNASLFGGAITTKRQYNNKSSSITVQIITDSQLIQNMMAIYSNPMLTTSDGGKLERIKREKAIVKFDPYSKKGKLEIIVADRFLVLVEGQEITKKELKDYASAIDYEKLKSLP